MICRLIENLSSTNAMKAGLKQKLAAVYDSTSIGDYREQKGKSDEIDALAKAIKEKKQVELVAYESALANKTKNYIVEPYALTKEYIDIWACDTASGHNKVFKISRIGELKILGDWHMEQKHERRPIDSFRMCGMTTDTLAEQINLRRLHLRRDGHPVTSNQIYAVAMRFPEMFVKDGRLIRLMV